MNRLYFCVKYTLTSQLVHGVRLTVLSMAANAVLWERYVCHGVGSCPFAVVEDLLIRILDAVLSDVHFLLKKALVELRKAVCSLKLVVVGVDLQVDNCRSADNCQQDKMHYREFAEDIEIIEQLVLIWGEEHQKQLISYQQCQKQQE